jgi:DNA-binding PadR family transcriptional regulator
MAKKGKRIAWDILKNLEKQNYTTKQLKEDMNLPRGTVNGELTYLTKQGFVEAVPVREVRREYKITEAGKKYLAELQSQPPETVEVPQSVAGDVQGQIMVEEAHDKAEEEKGDHLFALGAEKIKKQDFYDIGPGEINALEVRHKALIAAQQEKKIDIYDTEQKEETAKEIKRKRFKLF